MAMNFLGIDASSENISLCFSTGDKIILDFNKRISFGSSKIVFILQQYLKRKLFDLKKIDCLLVGRGPGSFTGLRVSYAVIKAFSLALNIPVIAVGSFFSMAYNFKDSEEKIAVVTDARKGLIYAAAFCRKKNSLIMEHKEQLISLDEFINKRKDHFFVTYDAHLRKKALEIFPRLRFYSDDIWPNAAAMVQQAKQYYSKGAFTPLEKLEPLYLHPKTCQIRSS